MTRTPIRDMRRRQRRRRKVRHLRELLAVAKTADERRRLIAKIQSISRTAPLPQ